MDFIRGQNTPYFSWDFDIKIWFRARGKLPGLKRNRPQGWMRKHLRANFIVVHRHEYFPPLFVELDCSKTRFDNPVLFLTRSNACTAWFQVMFRASFPVIIVQLRVMLEAGFTVIGSVYSVRWHPDREQEDFIAHFVSIANEASVEWRENNKSTHHASVAGQQSSEISLVALRFLPHFISRIFTSERSFKFNNFTIMGNKHIKVDSVKSGNFLKWAL